MSNCITYHTQIASIMEVLANAAVAEICKLVDDGYAEFRLEVSQSQKDNRTLKRKLQMMELRFARERAERTMRERILNCRSGGSRTLDRIRGSVGAVSGGGEWIPRMDTQGHVQEVNGSDAAFKSEPGTESVNQRLQHTGSEHTAQRLSQFLTGNNLSVCPQSKPPPTADRSSGSSGPSDCLDVKSIVLITDTVPVKVEECMSPLSWNKMTDPGSGQLSCNDFLGHMESIEPSPDIIVANSPSHVLMNNALVAKVITTDSNGHVPYDQIFTVSEMAEGHSFRSEPALHSPLHSASNLMKAEIDSEMIVSGTAVTFKERATGDCAAAPAEERAATPPPRRRAGDDRKRHSRSVHPVENQQGINTGEQPYTCADCGKAFNQRSNLTVHRMIHTGEKPYACTLCGKAFNQESYLKIHERIHSEDKLYECTDCGKTFNHGSNLKAHQRIHTGERPYVCTLCGKAFNQSSYLKIHERLHAGDKLHECTQCGKTFSQAHYLKVHEKTHAGQRTYACTQCGKTFNQASYLKVHQRIHKVDQTYTCGHCGKTFNQESYLRVHQRVHTGEKAHTCAQCGKIFSKSATLKIHLRMHSGERPHVCSLCGKKFGQAFNLRVHQRVHTGERPFACGTCGMDFSHATSLRRHGKLVHGSKD